MHHLPPGAAAIASARSRESVASSGPYPAAWPGSPDPPSQVASGTVRLILPRMVGTGSAPATGAAGRVGPAAGSPGPGRRLPGLGPPGSLCNGPSAESEAVPLSAELEVVPWRAELGVVPL